MKRYFDKTTKCSFRDPSDPHFIRFGSVRDKDPNLKITAGKLRLEGCACSSDTTYSFAHSSSRSDVASFFEPSIKCIVEGVLAQRRDAHKTISVSILDRVQ
jgi:hypothetical protein